ncbi:hypothetical protein [Myroides odoratus]|uniref:Uncharacterized protein n=1 Tax=Myroides odoratus TaxID=256 RepID=A0A378RNG7_MYROD|nr:hypothetical protein [Myroides odoratus]QQU04021.1 hypothetical protein I6I89_01625 [Myroides odoratus]STZ28593.1 Uncharacterised protein [Myroides odoratus]
MTITQHHLAIQAENERLKKENELMKQIASTEGFYDYYFKQISYYRNRREAFKYVNDLYKKYFGCHRYSDYDSFRITTNRRR